MPYPLYISTSKSDFVLPCTFFKLLLQHPDHPLPVQNTILCNHFLFSAVLHFHKWKMFEHSNGAFSPQLTARGHTSQIIANYVYVEVMAVEHFYHSLFIPLWLTVEQLKTEKFPTENSRQYLISSSIDTRKRQCRFCLHSDLYVLNTLLSHQILPLYFMQCNRFPCSVYFQ